MKSMKNKRGDISIYILVLGVFTVCALALASFLSNNFIPQKYTNPEVIVNVASALDNFYFYVHEGYSVQDAAKLSGGTIKGGNLIFSSTQYKSSSGSSLGDEIKSVSGKNQNPVMSVQYIVDISNLNP